MRRTVGHLAARVALVGGAVVGALHGAREATAGPLDPTTRAACVSHLPGTGARCDSDRFLTEVGPYVVPVGLGALAGVAVVVGILLLVRLGALALHGPRATTPVQPASPAWVLTPRSDPSRARDHGPPPAGADGAGRRGRPRPRAGRRR